MAVTLKDEYTKAEIDEAPIEVLEELAKNLTWDSRTMYGGYDYSTHTSSNKPAPSNNKFKTSGYPNRYRGQLIRSREQFLRARLKMTPKARINPEALERKKKEEEERYAKQPKVKVKTSIYVELKDARPKGHTFTIERKNGKLVCEQKSRNETGRVGLKICSAQGEFDAESFEAAIEMAESVKLPRTQTKKVKEAQLSVNASIILAGSHTLEFTPNGDGQVWIGQQDRYGDRPVKSWLFNIKDLKEVIKTMKSKYKVEMIEKKAETK